MDSPATCAMPTVIESNHSAAGTLHPHQSTTSMYALSHNYATKSPLVTMRCPTFTLPNCCFPSTISTPSNTPSLDRPTHCLKRHPDPIRPFSTIHPPDPQTTGIVRVPRPDFGPYPALRVKVFFFADSGSLDCMLQFPGG